MHAATSQRRSPFVRAFWVANIMEIFERFAWYGFFTVSSLYLTTPIVQGGLGFNEQQRGIIQGLVPFFLYLVPVITGALGDRYGYRKMFLASFVVMAPSYYLLGQVRSFWSFLFVFLAVALGAAMFKPLVVGTVSRTTDDSNRGLGFGIFYTLVNLGGFFGPVIAGAVRVMSWNLVFVCAAAWITVNFVPAIFWYRDPPSGEDSPPSTGLGQVLKDAQEVLGNGRFALVVVPMLVLLMVAGGGWLPWSMFTLVAGLWIGVNWLWNLSGVRHGDAPWYRQKIRLGNTPFVVYLLIMAGFWTTYTQIFNTLPIYLRDHVETADLVSAIDSVSPALARAVTRVNNEHLTAELQAFASQSVSTLVDADAIRRALVHHKVRVPVDEIEVAIPAIATGATDAEIVASRWAQTYRQVAPEYIMSLTFLYIILFQILVSRAVERRAVFRVLVVGTLLIGAGFVLFGATSAVAMGGVLVVVAIAVFSVGEMLASPKSQDYVAGVMPKAKAAMFMGYYFVSMALGFLFAGILSGWAYDFFCNRLQNPPLMWVFFAGLAVLTACGLLVFNRTLAPRLESES